MFMEMQICVEGLPMKVHEHWSPTNKDESTVVRSLTCYLLEVFFLVCPSIIFHWGLFFTVKCWGHWCNI